MASAGQVKLSREEYKKQKELEEARKAGRVAPELDDEGNMINPHIPQYISQAPWYLQQTGPGLKHQRVQKQEKKTSLDTWYERGKRLAGPAPTKFRKGACENCGAMTHKKKDCVERPRAKGAKWTGEDLQKDEFVMDVGDMEFEAKRDRWNGYDPSDYQEVIDEFDKVERKKLELRAQQVEDEFQDKEDEAEKAAADPDMLGYTEGQAMPGQKFDNKTRMSVRNLRIREDTAKYLLNLDVKSAYYDPKTRSMRENPFAGTAKEAQGAAYTTENFIRQTGDARKVAQAQLFAWQAEERGDNIHMQALPTAAEKVMKDQVEEKSKTLEKQPQSIIEKYGGAEHLEAPPPELLLGQTEHYIEYDRSGNVIKGLEKPIPKSKYEEDVWPGNHRSVWGSFWVDGQWGYACCHSTVYNAYCVGEAGKRARQKELESKFLAAPRKTLVEEHAEKLSKEEKKKKKKDKDKKRDDEENGKDSMRETKERMEQIKEILRQEDEREQRAKEFLSMDERKRPYNSVAADSGEKPTEEEMEAWMLKKARADDPMAQFM